MQVSIIDNSGRVSLANEIDKSFQSANQIEIASAFITSWSIQQLRNHLKNGRKQICLLIGLFGRFNKQEDLKLLLTLQKEFQGRFQVRISTNNKFHWKYFRFDGKKGFIVFIGSANFTREGLDKAGELVSKFENRLSRGIVEDASRAFAKQWEKSTKIESFPISKYHEVKRSPIANPNNPIDPQLSNLLKSPPFNSTQGEKKSQATKLRYVRVRDNVSLKTVTIVDKFHSEWTKKNYDYICFSHYSDFEQAAKANYLLRQYWDNKKWYFNIEKVCDDDSSLLTPDGKYFVAFKKQNQRSKIITNQFDQILQSCGIKYKSRKDHDKTLGSQQSKNILKEFGIKL